MISIAHRAVLLALLVSALAWVPAEGQHASTVSLVNVARSQELAARADAVLRLSDRSEWMRAAVLLRQAAELRAAGDPESVALLVYAGNVYFGAGRFADSRAAMEQAAQLALDAGDVMRAAYALHKAGAIAHMQKDQAAVRQLSRRAELLAKSPLLDDEQREKIRAYFTYPSPVAAN